MDGPFPIYTYPSAWNLPSWDPDCIAVQVFCSFCGISYETKESETLGFSPNESLPAIRFESDVVSGLENIIDFLVKKGYDLDRRLTPDESAESAAFIALIQNNLRASMVYNWFCNEDNLVAVTKPALTASLSFPLNTLWLRSLKSRLAKRYGFDVLPLPDPNKPYVDASRVYTALSTKLGTKHYFFGSRPSILDAVAFSSLLVQHHAPMPTAPLRSLISEHRNLVDYIERLWTALSSPSGFPPILDGVLPALLRKLAQPSPFESPHLPTAPTAPQLPKKRGPEKKARSRKEEDYRRRGRWFVVGSLASVALFAYLHKVVYVRVVM